MSLDITLMDEVHSQNITHNLGAMAKEAGIYKVLWRPQEAGVWDAEDLIKPLEAGILLMASDPERFKELDSPNGWGTYGNFLPWLAELLEACRKNPSSRIDVSV